MRTTTATLLLLLLPALGAGQEPPANGWLEVRSDPPGCSVKLNQQFIGQTPIEHHELPPGRYQVRVNSRCHHQYFKQVVVGRNEPAVVEAKMRPRLGEVWVTALDENDKDMKAAVFVDGKQAGQTPCKLEVPMCRRKFEIWSDRHGIFTDQVEVKERTFVYAVAGETWQDPDTGLIWQKRPQNKSFAWREGDEYCRGLILAGQTDWRLPSLPELQTILYGCTRTPGWRHCPENKGPSKHGCYWKPELEGTCHWARGEGYYWSSHHTRRHAAYIKFSSGVQASFTLGSRFSVRCVRGKWNPDQSTSPPPAGK